MGNQVISMSLSSWTRALQNNLNHQAGPDLRETKKEEPSLLVPRAKIEGLKV